ncbi:MAG TPA: hypothetical protein VFQ35_10480 [Polyangiaceae bacterium]|nr:hypothetical protein [Polyangiaceae bacterium]
MKALALAALLVLAACTSPQAAPTAPSTSSEGTAALPSFAPPSAMPARYLRTLEYEPSGYSAERAKRNPTSDLLLGDLLFHSPRTLGPRARSLGISCNSCHPNGAAHVTFELAGLSDRPGNVDLSSAFFRGASDDGIVNFVNIPSLRGCRYTGPYGHDGRTASLAEFMQSVVHVEFDGAPLSPEHSAALMRYVLDLDFLPNQNLDPRNRLRDGASAAAKRGALLFEAPRTGFGGASCASCHPASTFFRDGQVHRLGSAHSPSPYAIDGGYETPTLLGLAETAPYFHDGRFAHVADVVGWFDVTFSLGLTEAERSDLGAYVEAIGAVDRPRDDRPLAVQLDQVFSYVSLLSLDDQEVCDAARDEVDALLATAPLAMRARARDARKSLGALARSSERTPAAVSSLREELARLAADWAGALAPCAESPCSVQSKTTVLFP